MSVAHNRAAENNGPRWPDLHENAPRIPEFSSLFRPGHVNERVEVWRFEVQPWRRMEAGSRILIFIRASTPPRTTFHRPMWLVFLRLDGMEWSQNSARREVKRRRISGLGNYEPSPCVIGIQNLCQMYTYPILSMYFFFLFFQFFSSHFPEPSIKGYKSKTNTRVFIEKFAYFVLFLLSKLYKFSQSIFWRLASSLFPLPRSSWDNRIVHSLILNKERNSSLIFRWKKLLIIIWITFIWSIEDQISYVVARVRIRGSMMSRKKWKKSKREKEERGRGWSLM